MTESCTVFAFTARRLARRTPLRCAAEGHAASAVPRALRCAALATALAALWAPAPAVAQGLVCRATAPPVGAASNACRGQDRVRVAAVGDLLLHRPIQQRGYTDPDGFRSVWTEAETMFRLADVLYGNLEGPAAAGVTASRRIVPDPGPVFDRRVYTSFPLFNYHPRIAGDLVASGFDVVSTANNHAMDRGSVGADRTIDALTAAGLAFTGTIRAGAPRRFSAYTDTKLGRIAWIACSYSTNGLADPHRQVLLCYRDRSELLALVAAEAARPEIAAVIVTPHWGVQYSHRPGSDQKQLARQLVAAGAAAVIGTHPHVLQPWEELPAPGGSNSLVIYSTGNFVSSQIGLARRTGIIAMLEMCRPQASAAGARRNRLVVARAGYAPVLIANTRAGPHLLLVKTGDEGLPAQAARHAAGIIGPRNLAPQLTCRPVDAAPHVALQ